MTLALKGEAEHSEKWGQGPMFSQWEGRHEQMPREGHIVYAGTAGSSVPSGARRPWVHLPVMGAAGKWAGAA